MNISSSFTYQKSYTIITPKILEVPEEKGGPKEARKVIIDNEGNYKLIILDDVFQVGTILKVHNQFNHEKISDLYDFLSDNYIICFDKKSQKCDKLYTKDKRSRKGAERYCIGKCTKCRQENKKIKRIAKKTNSQITTKNRIATAKDRAKRRRQKLKNKRYYTKKKQEIVDARNLTLSNNQTDELQEVRFLLRFDPYVNKSYQISCRNSSRVGENIV